MSLFPMFIKLADRPCLVVGAGEVAQAKIGGLLSAGARVRVVAPRATETVRLWAARGSIHWQRRKFTLSDLQGVFLLIAATSSRELHEQIFQEAHRRNILCNVVDEPDCCDFYYPAVVRRGNLQIVISTAGHSPALAQRLRRELERQFGPEWESWVELLGRERRKLFEQPMDSQLRRQLLRELARQNPQTSNL